MGFRAPELIFLVKVSILLLLKYDFIFRDVLVLLSQISSRTAIECVKSCKGEGWGESIIGTEAHLLCLE